MDLVNQNKFKNILIIVLLGMNILTLSIIWMQTLRSNDDSSLKPKDKAESNSVKLMKDALDLNDEQAKQLIKIRSSSLDLSKKYKDSLDQLKKEMGEDFLKGKPDSAIAAAKTRKIGELEAKALFLQYQHFNELLAICTPEQREKLRPIIVELFNRRPPQQAALRHEPSNNASVRKNAGNMKNAETINLAKSDIKNTDQSGFQRERDDLRPAPPSIDEKMSRLSRKLNLSEEQSVKIRKLLAESRQKDQELRNRVNPDRETIEAEKLKNRNEEDESIMRILNADQKDEYLKIMNNRRR